MRKIIFSLLFFTLSIGVAAQTAKIKIRSVGLGRVSVTKGKVRSAIDLREDVAGCAYVSGKQKRELDKTGCASPPVTFKLIDATVKNNQTFLVVESGAMGNCNVCGRCGAAEAYALIWLKLNARLRVINKQSVPIEHCLTDISSVEVKMHEDDNLSDLRLSFEKNILTVEFEKAIFDNNANKAGYEFSHLEYNRKTPEKGLVVKTEKRDKSAMEN